MSNHSFCTYCGTRLFHDYKFCPNCGKNYEKSDETLLNQTKLQRAKFIKKPGFSAIILILVLVIGSSFYFLRTDKYDSEKLSTASVVCETLNAEIYNYFNYLDNFKNASAWIPWPKLNKITKDTSERLKVTARAVLAEDIEWDSSQVVSSLINGIANDLIYIEQAMFWGRLQPGSYESITQNYPSLDLNFEAVMTSACS